MQANFLKYVPLKKELSIVAGTLAVLIVLPILAVGTILDSGLSAVSGSIVSSNPQTHEVTIRNVDGSVKVVLQSQTVWPTTGKVSLEFGADDSPYQAHHTGIDIATPIGTRVGSFMAGQVQKVGYDSSEGNFIYIDHGKGIVSHYLHLSLPLALPGKQVNVGDEIGLSGNTGWSTGPHVHFEVRVNTIPVNPREFLSGNPSP